METLYKVVMETNDTFIFRRFAHIEKSLEITYSGLPEKAIIVPVTRDSWVIRHGTDRIGFITEFPACHIMDGPTHL